MGKTANLTVVTKTMTDTLHKEEKPQKVITKEVGCSQSAASKHINRKLCGREKCRRKRCTSSRKMTTAWRRLSGKGHSKVLVTFTRSGLRLESVHQEPPHTDGSWTRASNVVFLSSSHSWTTNVRSILPGLKKKQTWSVAQWSKVLFSDESKFCPILLPCLKILIN